MNSRTRAKFRRRGAGALFLVVLVLLGWLSVAVYQKKFATVAMVTLYTSSAGNEMNLGAEVKVRGVVVGEVRQITADGSGARLELAINPGVTLPANVSAEMLPATLFGERYVDLMLPAAPSPQLLANGSVIAQDRSGDAVELERVLNNLLPLLNATEPDKLSLVLDALAHGLQGRGTELGQTLTTLNSYLGQLNPQLPALDTDIRELSGLARTVNQAAPGIVSALNDFTATSQVIARQRASVTALFANLTTAATDLREFLAANQQNIITLAADSPATLAILANYAPEFPCTLQDLVNFEPAINKVLGQGTSEPGLHVSVTVVPSLGRYLPGKDTPAYGDNTGPHCYPSPFPGITLHDNQGATQDTTQDTSTAPGGAPRDSALVRELAAMTLGRPPAAVPGWSSLLVGPLYRGAKVTLK